MLSALLRAGHYLTAGLSYLSTADSILMSTRYQPLRFCLSAIPTCRSLPLIDILFSVPTLPHFLPTCALHGGGAAQRVSKRFVLVSWLCNRVMKRCCQG